MDGSATLSKKSAGQQLTIAESQVLLSKMIDLLCEGYMTTHALAKKLRVSRGTIDRYRPLADDIIARQQLDRNVIRNLQVKRTYELIETLMNDLKQAKEPKDRALYFNQIYKFSSHLALITGLNIETHVHADPSKLVIIRSGKSENPKKANVIEQETEQTASVLE